MIGLIKYACEIWNVNEILIIVTTLAVGSQPRQKGLTCTSQKECENEYSHSQVSSPFANWSPGGLLNLQRTIVEVKTSYIEKLFISLESY